MPSRATRCRLSRPVSDRVGTPRTQTSRMSTSRSSVLNLTSSPPCSLSFSKRQPSRGRIESSVICEPVQVATTVPPSEENDSVSRPSSEEVRVGAGSGDEDAVAVERVVGVGSGDAGEGSREWAERGRGAARQHHDPLGGRGLPDAAAGAVDDQEGDRADGDHDGQPAQHHQQEWATSHPHAGHPLPALACPL